MGHGATRWRGGERGWGNACTGSLTRGRNVDARSLQGGFSEADGEDIPAPPNAWEQIWGNVGAEYDMLKKDISTLMRFKKNALIVVFSAGGVVGVLLAFCMFAGLGGLNPPVEYVEQQLEQQQTEPVNGAGDGAGAGAAADSTTPKATSIGKKKESKKTR